jgi:hypothetical protein
MSERRRARVRREHSRRAADSDLEVAYLDPVLRLKPNGKVLGAWGMLGLREVLDSCRPQVPCKRC